MTNDLKINFVFILIIGIFLSIAATQIYKYSKGFIEGRDVGYNEGFNAAMNERIFIIATDTTVKLVIERNNYE